MTRELDPRLHAYRPDLAEMAAELLREAEVPVSQVQAVPDSYQAQAFLREGTVDLMVDYSGTALNFLGELNVSGDSTIMSGSAARPSARRLALA